MITLTCRIQCAKLIQHTINYLKEQQYHFWKLVSPNVSYNSFFFFYFEMFFTCIRKKVNINCLTFKKQKYPKQASGITSLDISLYITTWSLSFYWSEERGGVIMRMIKWCFLRENFYFNDSCKHYTVYKNCMK